MPDEREVLVEATSCFERALLAVEAREMTVLPSVAHRWAEKSGGIAFDASAYAALMERAHSLDARPHLPEDLRNAVDGILVRDACWSLNRGRVDAFLGRAAEVERTQQELGQKSDTMSILKQPQTKRDLRQKEKEILDEAAVLRRDMPKRELAAHLRAAGVGPDAVCEREKKIRETIAHEEEKLAAQRMRQSWGMSM